MLTQVVMDEEGCVTLPPEMLARLGWHPETPLMMTMLPDGALQIEEIEPEGT